MFLLTLTGAPAIEYDPKYKTQSMKAGMSIIILADISGFPVPNVTWFHNDQEVTQTDKITIEGDKKFTRLTMMGTTAKTSGSYKLVAVNDIGTAEETFDVTILGKMV